MKRLGFRRKRGHERSANGSNRDSGETLLPPNSPNIARISQRDGSPAADSKYSSSGKSVVRKITTFFASRDASRRTEAPIRDPVGLRVIHRPAGDCKADIVFIHGLGGSSQMTWSHNRNLDFFWPLKFLPLEPGIGECRILTFGYNADFRPGSVKNKLSVLDFAKDLLYELKYAQDESAPGLGSLGIGEKPIIFIVHSMGGLVAKEAFVLGQTDPTYESIVRAASAIIFLSTPHRGTNLAETLNRILQVSFATSPRQFISDLAAGSQTIQKLNEQFRHVAPKLEIVSFYETQPTLIMGSRIMVLEKDSSVLGYPGEISKPLDADHHGVCKYASQEDPSYIAVRNVLRTLVSKSKVRVVSEENASIFSFEEYLCLSESPDVDYNFFRDRWTPGTCSWILTHEIFTTWKDDTSPSPRVLCITGDAASGKSILSSFIINHFAHQGLPCHYFFIRFISQEKCGLSMILRSLACQLANSIPAYADKLRRLEAAPAELKTADYRNIWQRLFKQTLFRLGFNNPVYIILDGIDEAEQPDSVIRLLSELGQTTLPLRVLVVGRKTPEISSAFRRLAKQVHMETMSTEENVVDLRSFIDHEMNLTGDDFYRDHVTSRLLEQAHGNFLWIHLAVQNINTCHTKSDVEKALRDFPSGMEALYSRMALSVQSQSSTNGGNLGQEILRWTACARRPLSIEELKDALDNNGVLDIHRTIADLCGGFVTVDQGSRVTMIHETAREYLMREPEIGQQPIVDRRAANMMLLKRCLTRLSDPTLRGQINRGEAPALLGYSVTAWPYHLASIWPVCPDVVEDAAAFLRGPHVLTWIYSAARDKELKALVVASRYITEAAAGVRKTLNDQKSAIDIQKAPAVLEGWAIDLVKLVGKFGDNLGRSPGSIYKIIPPFCPASSMLYQQFGYKETRALRVSGFTSTTWDDCLARLVPIQGSMASSIIAAGSRIVVLTVVQKTSQLTIYNSSTFEEQRRVSHQERVLSIQANKLGDLVVSYGYMTTKVWDISTGECVRTVKNPPERPRPLTLFFDDKHQTVLSCSEDRCIRSFPLDINSKDEWALQAQIVEQTIGGGAIVNSPVCSAFSPDGNMIAFGYRSYPATVWELEPPMLRGQCYVPLDATDRTVEKSTFGEVYHLAWHPFSGEVFGLTQVGLLFRWNPHEENASAKVQSGANCITVSPDGSLVATGDAVGAIKLYTAADFTLLYQLYSQDWVLQVSFSTDSRHLYDVRGFYADVWEPNTLMLDSGKSKNPYGEAVSLDKVSIQTERCLARIDNVNTLAGQFAGPLYCFGTEEGVANLCEVGRGKVCNLERLPSFMSFEHVAWSNDGRLLALVDLGRKLRVKSVFRSTENQGAWQVFHEFSLAIPTHREHVNQLIFQSAGDKLLMSTSTALLFVDVSSHSLSEVELKGPTSALKWACHPLLPDTLLGFGVSSVHVLSWTNPENHASYDYTPPRIDSPSSHFFHVNYAEGRTGRVPALVPTLERLISGVGSPYILLEICRLDPSVPVKREYLLFDVSDQQLAPQTSAPTPHETNNSASSLCFRYLPSNVASRVRVPLTFLSRRRFVFLDVDRWICTWRVPVLASPTAPFPSSVTPTSTTPQARNKKDSPSTAAGIEQLYFLPGDWVTGNDVHFLSVTPDGTLLCPRNGDVVAVQAANLRK